jgi:hypothetical protein
VRAPFEEGSLKTPVTFFIDRSLGQEKVVAAMRAKGAIVERNDDHRRRAAKDAGSPSDPASAIHRYDLEGRKRQGDRSLNLSLPGARAAALLSADHLQVHSTEQNIFPDGQLKNTLP